MIRINLIAERKASAPKAAKSTAQYSELQENIVLIAFVALALIVFMVRRTMLNNERTALQTTKTNKEKEYKAVEKWKDLQLDYEVQKELLNEKIQKISQLRDRRQGPVKLLEDVFNNTPSSIYLATIEQGYDKRLVEKPGPGQAVFNPGSNPGAPNMFKITGYSKTIDAASTLANRLFAIPRYTDGSLNTVIEQEKGDVQGEFLFTIFFKTTSGGEKAAAEKKVGQEGSP
ncbi:MAG: hypothetical protein KDC35_04300 [Acidobacteria bacterium]|nr:hypothetical protein [Acidobacteriota bacterium]